jgi:serine/threonine-protein kinase HipA
MKSCKISLRNEDQKRKYQDYNNTEFKKIFGSLKVNPVLPFSRSQFAQEAPKYSKGMSISGVQQKLSLRIVDNQFEMVAQGGDYILKPSPESYPFASENEHCAMLSAKLLKIETAPCALLSFSDGELVYVTKRFDRNQRERLHQEDLASGFGLYAEQKYEKSYEECGYKIKEMTNKLSAVSDFIIRLIHTYTIGNDDMHLKNISLFREMNNRSLYYDRLTPLYDVLFVSAFPNAPKSSFFALDFFKDDEFTPRFNELGFFSAIDFVELGRRLGINEKVVRNHLTQVLNKENELISLIEISYMPESMKQRACDQVYDRINALKNGY